MSKIKKREMFGEVHQERGGGCRYFVIFNPDGTEVVRSGAVYPTEEEAHWAMRQELDFYTGGKK